MSNAKEQELETRILRIEQVILAIYDMIKYIGYCDKITINPKYVKLVKEIREGLRHARISAL